MLSNKVALVTGASRGIGKEIAKTFAREGATVIVNYSGSVQAAELVVKEIEQQGGTAKTYQCNVACFDDVKVMIDSIIKEYGSLDILVNNAGITRDNLLLKMSEQDFNEVFETNLKGAFNTIKHSTKQMMKQRAGKIINISSVSGLMGNAGQANYSAAKAGIIGLTKAVARELASRNINVNAVAPGFISTDMTEVLSDTVKESVTANIPFRRFGKPSDIAEMVLFLASDKADYITGQVFCVDGGICI